MTSSEFIISKLKSFINEFPGTRVRYEHDEKSNTHFIEVVPNEVYHFDNKYIQWESKFFDEFTEQFPSEIICFISDDALVGIDKVDFEIRGSKYFPTYSTNNQIIKIPIEKNTPDIFNSFRKKESIKFTVNNNLTFFPDNLALTV